MGRSLLVFALLVFGVSGCPVPDPAPEDLSGLLRFAFSHYPTDEATNDASLADAGANLLDWWENEAALAEDFSEEDGFGATLTEEIDRLSATELETLDPPALDARGEEAVGVIVAMRTTCSLADIDRLYTEDDQLALFPDNYLSYVRSEQRYDCFLQGECPEATWASTIEQNIFGNLDATYLLNNQMRDLDAEDLEGVPVRARVVRAWFRGDAELSDPNLGGWYQNYQLEFIIEVDGGVLHVYPQWVEVEITGVDTESGWLLGQYVIGLRDYIRQLEEHCDAG